MPTRTPSAENALNRISKVIEVEEDNALIVKRIAGFLNHEDPRVREAVGLGFMNAPHESSAPHIKRGLSDPNLVVREAFVRATAENGFKGFSNRLGRMLTSTHPMHEELRFALANAIGKVGHTQKHLNYLTVKEGDEEAVIKRIKNARGQILDKLKKQLKAGKVKVARVTGNDSIEQEVNDGAIHEKVLNLIEKLRHAKPAARSKAATELMALTGGLETHHPLKRALQYLNPEKHPHEFGELYRRGAGGKWKSLHWEATARVLKRGKRSPKKR